jgi:hypothetical protein
VAFSCTLFRVNTVTVVASSLFLFSCCTTQVAAQAVAVDPGKMPAVATVDTRFQSYNIEMVEVTGGRFWKPYSSYFL